MFKNIKLNYRLAAINDLPMIVELMNNQYNRKKDNNYFKWLYFKSFYKTKIMCAVKPSGHIIGIFGLQERKLKSGAIVAQAIDLLISKNYRGIGVFHSLAEKSIACFDDIDLLCVLANQNGRNAIQRALNWKCISKIDNLILNPKNKKKIFSQQTIQNKITDGFYYDEQIINWRFFEHPEFEYTKFENKEGYVITKIFTEPMSKNIYGDIVYYRFITNNIFEIHSLFEKVIEYFLSINIKEITTWALPHTLIFKILLCFGFIEQPQERYFCLKVLNKNFNNLKVIDEWNLMQSDSEIF